MPFSGLSTADQFGASGGSLIHEDLSPLIAELSIRETPILDWLGDGPYSAQNVLHEFLEEELRPNTLIASTAINSATANTGVLVAANVGSQLTVGTLVENETDTTNATNEVMQVISIAGPTSVLFSRAFMGTANGSLAVGGSLFIRAPLALEGQDAVGDVTRPRRRKQTYVKLFQLPITISDTQLAVRGINVDDEWEHQKTRRLIEMVRDLEKEVVRGVPSNSIGGEANYRSFAGLRFAIGSINSLLGAGSFAANPHLYLGNAWKSAYGNGLRETETVGLLCGASAFRDISNLNDTKVQDSNTSTLFQRQVREYAGPFGRATAILSPWMPDYEVLGVVRERVKVIPLQGRSFQYVDLAKTGSAKKGMTEGEYTLEIHHPQAMFRIRGVA